MNKDLWFFMLNIACGPLALWTIIYLKAFIKKGTKHDNHNL